MAISTSSVTRAQCDACPAVVYAEGGAQPKGLQVSARETDGNGREVSVVAFACQLQHVGKAIANAIKAAKASGQVAQLRAALSAPEPTQAIGSPWPHNGDPDAPWENNGDHQPEHEAG